MAAPSVTGVASLVLSYFPKISATRLKEIILESGLEVNFHVNHDEKDILFEDLSRSGKIVNAYNALLLASGKKNKE
jgi:subtilisin family serine protease